MPVTDPDLIVVDSNRERLSDPRVSLADVQSSGNAHADRASASLTFAAPDRVIADISAALHNASTPSLTRARHDFDIVPG
jgi:hypothetical protein